MSSTRIEKVNSLLQHEISKIIVRDFNFPDALITLSHVDASANLIEAKAYISVLPSASAKAMADKEEKTDMVIKTLNNNVYDIQQKINKMLNMRPIPKIRFVKDEVIAKAAKIEEILETLKKAQ